jgi:hypothetical protein
MTDMIKALRERSEDDPEKPGPYWDGWHAALDAVSASLRGGAGKHQREEPHHYDIVCRTCGQPGVLKVSVDPNFPDPDLIAKIEGEFH